MSKDKFARLKTDDLSDDIVSFTEDGVTARPKGMILERERELRSQDEWAGLNTLEWYPDEDFSRVTPIYSFFQ